MSSEAARSALHRILDRARERRPLDESEVVTLLSVERDDLEAVRATADALRVEQAGELVTFVVNRNVNFTNACVKTCHFCAFSRKHRSGEAYFLSEAEVVGRALEARAHGATEVCLQAGLAPGMDGHLYERILRAIRAEAPELHLHAYSPEEVKYGAQLTKRSVRDHLLALREAGLGTLPGTSAEILDDGLRQVISPGRISVAEWEDTIRTAHELGIRTTSTIMFGHAENALHRARHLLRLRAIQHDTGGFTEIVPLSFVHDEAPMYARRLVPGLTGGPTPADVSRQFAVTRIVLGDSFRNVQVSWVKQGLARAGELLHWGVNDLGGTLMNESISTAAGAAHGQLARPRELKALARAAGRMPAERDTLYRIRARFSLDGAGDADHPLDSVGDSDGRFGSFVELTKSERHRFSFRHPLAR